MSERVSPEDLAELEQLWTEANTKVFGAEYTVAEGRQASDNFHAAVESLWPQLIAELRALRLTDDDRAALAWASWMCGAGNPRPEGDWNEARHAVVAVLARLIGTTKAGTP